MKYLLVSFGVWSFITAVTSIGDIVLMSLLANDLSVFNDEVSLTVRLTNLLYRNKFFVKLIYQIP